jgi:hypothetical protein
MGVECFAAIQSEFESFCNELSLAELFGNCEVWLAIQRIEELLSLGEVECLSY